jgi:hypothetical protein
VPRKVTEGGAYAADLARWARALAIGDANEVFSALAEGSAPWQVEEFIDSNREKRCQLLEAMLEPIAAAFDDLEGLLHDYLHEAPMPADATGSQDADDFLAWLEREGRPTPEQRDHIACQRARFAVERAARRNRTAHLRFQEMWSVAGRLAADLGDNPGLHLHLNPLRARARFRTAALLGGAAQPPANVVFFAVRDAVSTALLGPEGEEMLRALERCSPCVLGEWAALCPEAGVEELIAVGRDLASMGLVAFR